MKAVKISLAGQEYVLAFNGAAMFAVDEQFGGVNKLLDAMRATGAEGFDWVCRAVVVLAEQGELARRALGYDHGPMLREESIRALAMPGNILAFRQAVLNAITLGFGREVESSEDVDLGLIELEQKKTKK